MGAQRTRLRFEEIKKVVSEKQKRTVLKCYTSRVSKKTRLKKTIFKKINLFFLLFYFLLSLSFSQQDNLCIKGTLQTQTLTIKGSDTLPASPTKGEIYYKTDEDTIYFYDGSQWQKIGEGQDKTVASQIVRTQNSRYDADKTCDGTDDQEEINQAINELGSSGKGGVYLLEGEYIINTLPSGFVNYCIQCGHFPGLLFSGTGAGTVLKLKDYVSRHWYDFIQSFGSSRQIFQNFRVDGNKDNQSNCGKLFNPFSGSILENVWMENFECIGFGNVGDAIITTSFARDFSCCTNVPYFILYGGRFIVSNMVSINIKLRFIGSNYPSMNDMVVTFNIFENTDSILSAPSQRGIFVGYSAYQCGYLISSTGSSLIIVGNNLANSTRGHVALINSSKSLINNNSFSNVKCDAIYLQATADFNLILGNLITEIIRCGIALKRGIYLSSTIDFTLISSNLINDETHKVDNAGIRIESASSSSPKNNYLVGNFVINGFKKPIHDKGINTFYTDKLKLTLEGKPLDISNSTYTLDMTTNPRTYFQLNPQVNTTLSLQDGKSPGDLLILENVSSSHTITISESTNVELEKNTLTLGQNDTLMLLWDGTKWIQTAHSDN